MDVYVWMGLMDGVDGEMFLMDADGWGERE